MARVLPVPESGFDLGCDVAVVGAGACGLTAGLRALEAGTDVVVLERDAVPTGSTAMSSGFVPAPATRFQRALGIEDSPELFARDIQEKAGNGADPGIVAAVTDAIGPALEWLADAHGLEWVVLDDFLYPGHSRHRMHGVPERTGAGLMGRLVAAAEAAGLTLVGNARVTTLFRTSDGRIAGIALERPDGTVETLGCRALVLACNGYGGNRELVARHIPEMAEALYHGHAGNQGDALLWGETLGAGLEDLTAYQGHGSLAHPHGILITWALMMEGAIQVDCDGRRFSNEHSGYSEQAERVLGRPGGIAWNLYDKRLHRLGSDFADYRQACAAGAVRTAATLAELAALCGLPASRLAGTLREVESFAAGEGNDPFGRDFAGWRPFAPPLHAVRVTGALFHTQGGLAVAPDARVLDRDERGFANLFAAGGAARGVSGPRVEGYLSGNGLLTAIGLGYLAGHAAAQCCRAQT